MRRRHTSAQPSPAFARNNVRRSFTNLAIATSQFLHTIGRHQRVSREFSLGTPPALFDAWPHHDCIRATSSASVTSDG